jgi:general secretion pathway protein G
MSTDKEERMKRQKGFTLIELLIVVAIIGIIAAIAIPNLLNAINRGRQKRTMSDIRSIATALEAYSVDFNFYPKGISGTTVAALDTYITPTFIKRLPTNDGWNQTLLLMMETAGQSYTVYSAAKGGGGTVAGPGPKTDFADAIVFSNGQFYAWPEGMQTN